LKASVEKAKASDLWQFYSGNWNIWKLITSKALEIQATGRKPINSNLA